MTDEGRRDQVKDEHVVKQSSELKPITQSDGQEIHILREKIEKDILDKTTKALMKLNNDRERACSAERWLRPQRRRPRHRQWPPSPERASTPSRGKCHKCEGVGHRQSDCTSRPDVQLA